MKVKGPAPSTPPSENRTAEKITVDSVLILSVAVVRQPQVSQQHSNAASVVDGFAALDRCISLCRFTL